MSRWTRSSQRNRQQKSEKSSGDNVDINPGKQLSETSKLIASLNLHGEVVIVIHLEVAKESVLVGQTLKFGDQALLVVVRVAAIILATTRRGRMTHRALTTAAMVTVQTC